MNDFDILFKDAESIHIFVVVLIIYLVLFLPILEHHAVCVIGLFFIKCCNK